MAHANTGEETESNDASRTTVALNHPVSVRLCHKARMRVVAKECFPIGRQSGEDLVVGILRRKIRVNDVTARLQKQCFLHANVGAMPVALPRTPASHPVLAPYGAHRTRDGQVIVGLQNEREWASFCAKLPLRELGYARREVDALHMAEAV